MTFEDEIFLQLKVGPSSLSVIQWATGETRIVLSEESSEGMDPSTIVQMDIILEPEDAARLRDFLAKVVK